MKWLRILFATAALLLPLGALTRLPYTSPASDDALLRLSWRVMVSAQEKCRARSQSELDALPVHMRTPQVCERDDASYALITRLDETHADTVELLRGGVKGDRPLFVLEQRKLTPGEHHLTVMLRHTSRSGDSLLMRFDTTVTFRPGRVALVTLGPDGRRLTIRAQNPAGEVE